MGCYINPLGVSKEQWLNEKSPLPARMPGQITGTHVPICWVDNGGFTAAAVAYDTRELARFSDWANDPRPHLWFYATRDSVRKVSDLAEYEAHQTAPTR